MMLAAGTSPVRSWKNKDKLIVVITPDWNSVGGTLTRYERRGEKWKQAGKSISVVVGRNGLAWDPALVRGNPEMFRGVSKHEGDGRSPAGVFELNRGTFGFAPSLGTVRNYRSLTPTTECVDDSDSRYYAQIVDRLRVRDVDWKSSEKMREVRQYRWGVVVNYNMDHPVRGDGSCIFLHQWDGPAKGTAGCTAMPGDDIEAIVPWLDRGGDASLVELPQAEYDRLRGQWALP